MLDQYGYKEVPLGLLRRIFSRFENAEIILTFAVDHLVDFLIDSRQSKSTLEGTDLHLPFESIKSVKETEGPEWKRAIQLALHEQIPKTSKAGYYTPFFIQSPESHRGYWLVHLSNHPTARDVMTELHWQKHNYFEHFGKAGFRMLAYDPRKDFESQGYLTFKFDSPARALTADAVREDIPRRLLAAHRDGVSVGEFLASVSNETPATRAIIKEVIQELSRNSEIELRAKSGRRRQRGANPDSDDMTRTVARPVGVRLRGRIRGECPRDTRGAEEDPGAPGGGTWGHFYRGLTIVSLCVDASKLDR